MIRSLLRVCVLGCSAAAAVAQTPEGARPNILLIVADDLGWNDIGYHNARLRTPVLDRLAAEGVELDCHYVQPQCTPTRVALMTGRYPSRFGTPCLSASNAKAFDIGTPTLATVLRSAGYATGMSGKWHLGSDEVHGPKHHGFDHSHGSYAGAVGMYDHRYRLDTPYADTWHRNHEPLEQEGHATDLTTAEVVGWIDGHREPDKPWFFYVPFHAVHTPLVERDRRWTEMNAHIESADRRLYAAAVSHMDAAIGEMIEALRRTGQLERTLVVFTSDNGAQVRHAGDTYPAPDPSLKDFSSNQPLRGEKCDVYEGGFRVPALVSWPGTLPAHRVAQPMHAVDWLPTLARLVGAALDEEVELDGRDVWEHLARDDTPVTARTIYTVWGNGRRREALRYGDWKIVRNAKKAPWELFNVTADPREATDVASDRPEVVQELLRRRDAELAKDAR